MYVVRKAFRNHNRMIAPGSIIEPGDIKWFKTRLRDRAIIEVTEQSLDKWDEYFKEKFSVSIKDNLKETTEETTVEPAKEPVAEPVVITEPTATKTTANVEKPKAVGVVRAKATAVK